MKIGGFPINDFGDDSSNVIPAKAGIQDVFVSFNTKEEEKNLDPQSSWG